MEFLKMEFKYHPKWREKGKIAHFPPEELFWLAPFSELLQANLSRHIEYALSSHPSLIEVWVMKRTAFLQTFSCLKSILAFDVEPGSHPQGSTPCKYQLRSEHVKLLGFFCMLSHAVGTQNIFSLPHQKKKKKREHPGVFFFLFFKLLGNTAKLLKRWALTVGKQNDNSSYNCLPSTSLAFPCWIDFVCWPTVVAW